MSQTVGGKIKNVFVTVLVGLLVLAFAVWGVNDMFVPGVRNAVISVGDESVSTRDFDRDLRNELRNIAVQRGEGLTNEQAYQQGVHRNLIDRYLVRAAIAKDADDLGVGVNRADAREYIESIPAFQSEITGTFDRTKLNSILGRRNDYSLKEFEEDTLRDLRRQQSVDAIISGIEAPSGYAKRYFDFISEQRRATILTLNKDAVPAPPAPTDAELQEFIDQNAVRYTAPEYRQLTMIRLEPWGYAQDLTVTEEDVQSEYDRRVSAGVIGSPETRDVIVITASDETTAQEAATRLATGEETPELIATSLGLLPPDTFEGVEKDSLIDANTDATAFEVAEGEAKAAVNSLGSWEAIYVRSVTPAENPNFAALEPELRREIANDMAQDKILDVQDSVDAALTEGQTLEDIAKTLNLPMESYDYFDRAGQTRDGLRLTGSTRIPGIAADDELLREIFVADVGFESDPIETAQEGMAVFRVTDVIDSQVRQLDDIREQVTTAWTNEKIDEALVERGLALSAELRDGKTLETLAEELGEAASLRDLGISRASPPRDVGNSVIVDLLTGEPNDIVRGDGALPQTYVLGRLDRIIPNTDGLAGEVLDVLQGNLTNEISADIQTAYQQAILREHELREYPDQVRAIMGIETPN